MAAPRMTSAERDAAEALGLEFSEPPEPSTSRRSKHAELFDTAKALCRKNPGKRLRMLTYNNASQPYSLAKEINNSLRKEFVTEDGDGEFSAYATKIPTEDGTDLYGIWLTWTPSEQ